MIKTNMPQKPSHSFKSEFVWTKLTAGQIASNKPAFHTVLPISFQTAIGPFLGTISINLHSVTGRLRKTGMSFYIRARESSLLLIHVHVCVSPYPYLELWLYVS